MTEIESLPAYAAAEAVARSRGDDLMARLNDFLAWYAAEAMHDDTDTTSTTPDASSNVSNQ